MCGYDGYLHTCNHWSKSGGIQHTYDHGNGVHRPPGCMEVRIYGNLGTKQTVCPICNAIAPKQRTIADRREKIARWELEGGKDSSIDTARRTIAHEEDLIRGLMAQYPVRV